MIKIEAKSQYNNNNYRIVCETQLKISKNVKKYISLC